MDKQRNSPGHPALLLHIQPSKGIQDGKGLSREAEASLASQRGLLSFSVDFELCQSILSGYHI